MRDIKSYNRMAAETEGMEKLPYIAIVIDELADLMMVAGKEVGGLYLPHCPESACGGHAPYRGHAAPPRWTSSRALSRPISPAASLSPSAARSTAAPFWTRAARKKLLGMGDMLFMPVGAKQARPHPGDLCARRRDQRRVELHQKSTLPLITARR